MVSFEERRCRGGDLPQATSSPHQGRSRIWRKEQVKRGSREGKWRLTGHLQRWPPCGHLGPYERGLNPPGDSSGSRWQVSMRLSSCLLHDDPGEPA